MENLASGPAGGPLAANRSPSENAVSVVAELGLACEGRSAYSGQR
jgi:xanthine/CO dehydrogenase XdhC/CoxF family maturation factor